MSDVGELREAYPDATWAKSLVHGELPERYSQRLQRLVYFDYGGEGYRVRKISPADLVHEMLGNGGQIRRRDIADDDIYEQGLFSTLSKGQMYIDGSLPVDQVFRSANTLARSMEDSSWIDADMASVEKMVGYTAEIRHHVESPDELTRLAAARMGIGLDRLVNDGSDRVRRAVALHGFASDMLKADPSKHVRAAVAKSGKCLKELVKDPAWEVRREVAIRGYAWQRLAKDKVAYVREGVAVSGRGLDVLFEDKDEDVYIAVQEYLLKRYIPQSEWGTTPEDNHELAEEALGKWVARYPDLCLKPDNRKNALDPLKKYRRQHKARAAGSTRVSNPGYEARGTRAVAVGR